MVPYAAVKLYCTVLYCTDVQLVFVDVRLSISISIDCSAGLSKNWVPFQEREIVRLLNADILWCLTYFMLIKNKKLSTRLCIRNIALCA